MKVDAYNTLTSMAEALQSDEAAENTPFVLAIGSPDGEGVAVVGCNTSINFTDLVRSIMKAYVGTLKKAVKEGIDAEEAISEQLATICGEAMAKNFAKEKASKLDKLVDKLPDDLKEALSEIMEKLEEEDEDNGED